MKKFYNYVEIEKRKTGEENSSKSLIKNAQAFVATDLYSAIIQGAIITGLTVALILIQAIFADVSLIQFLSL